MSIANANIPILTQKVNHLASAEKNQFKNATIITSNNLVSNIVTPKNRLLMERDKFGTLNAMGGFNLKYNIPKNVQSKIQDLSHFKNLGHLKLSNSMKSLNEDTKKNRAVSYSPKGETLNVGTVIKKSPITKTIDPNLPINNNMTAQKNLNMSGFKYSKLDSEGNIASSSTVGSREERLPISNSNSNHTLIQTIYSLFYNKLIEEEKKLHSNNTISQRLDSVSKCFEFLSTQIDPKFKKISQMLKIEPDKCSPQTQFHSQLKLDNDKLKSEISKLDKIVLELNEKIHKMEATIKEKDATFTSIKKKFTTQTESNAYMQEENKKLKNSISDLKSELEYFREKEYKMMQVMYLLKKKGVAIDEVIQEIQSCSLLSFYVRCLLV